MLDEHEGLEAPTTASDFAPVKSADRTLEVLEYLAAKGSVGLVEMSKMLGIPKSSLHSILRTLEHRGWAESDASRSTYRLGMNSLLTGASYVDQDLVVARTSDALDLIASTIGETVHLGRLEGNDVVYMAKRESRHPLRMFSAIGRRLPAHATGLGKALLAELDDDRILASMVNPLVSITEHTIVSKEELVKRLDVVRTAGYAIDDEEACIGMRCFAVALPFASPSKDAISCSVPFARLDDAREAEIIELLLSTKAKLASQNDRGRTY